MSKGKPTKWSTTLFVFYAQSFKVGGGSYCLGMGDVWRSNSNLGSHPFLGKCVLAYWESKCLEMPSQAIIDPYVLFLTQLEIAGAFSFTFLLFFHFSHGWEFDWEILSGWHPPLAFLLWYS